MRSAQLGYCVLPPAGARRCEAKYRGIEREHRAQCARVRRCKEEHTLTELQSWGPSNDCELGMVNLRSQSKTPQSLEDGHIYCIWLLRIVFCHASKILPLPCLFYVTMNIYLCFYFNIARDVVMGLLIFVNKYYFDYALSHAHTEAHTHKHTCMISTQEGEIER